MRQTIYAILLLIGILSTPLLADARTSARSASTAEMAMPMPSVAPLFIESPEFSSALNLVNELNTPLKATVEMYSLDGEKILSRTLDMNPYSLQVVA